MVKRQIKNIIVFVILILFFHITLKGQVASSYYAGTGTESDPYQISTPQELRKLSNDVMTGTVSGGATNGKYYVLINDIDFNKLSGSENLIYDWSNNSDPTKAGGDGNESNFIPIGGWNTATTNNITNRYFDGTFDGQNFKIIGLRIKKRINLGVEDCGLFGLNGYNGIIKNVILDDIMVSGYSKVGGLVGVNYTGKVENCGVTNGNIQGNDDTGGLVGRNRVSANITNSFADNMIVVSNDRAGGLVGFNNETSKISKCFAKKCNVTSTSKDVGGLVGDLGDGSACSLELSYSTYCNVTGKNYVGGLFGGATTAMTVKNCYSTFCSVEGVTYVGGLGGYTENAKLENCYTTNEVKLKNGSNTHYGGLSGFSNSVTNCYYIDSWKLNPSVSQSTTAQKGTTKTSNEIQDALMVTTLNASQNPYPWISDYKSQINGGYPILKENNNVEIPLPVTWLGFEGRCDNGKILLNWLTASETNNEYFVIEKLIVRENDYLPQKWTEIDRIYGAGNSKEIRKYEYIDNSSIVNRKSSAYANRSIVNTNSSIYYRIKQIDYDGKFDYSKIIFVENCKNEGNIKINVFPNPNDGKFVIDLNNSNEVGAASYQIFDIKGTVWVEGNLENYEKEINKKLKSGSYFIRIYNENNFFQERFLVY